MLLGLMLAGPALAAPPPATAAETYALPNGKPEVSATLAVTPGTPSGPARTGTSASPSIRFPQGGGWHVHADAVPSGLGQQVMRFDIGSDPAAPPPMPQPTGLAGSDGRYGVRFDALDLRAEQDAQLKLHVLRDGRPAPDLAPFLGVAAHAVFISAADLAYVHAHAAPAAAGAAHHHGTAGMPGMESHPPGAKLPANLVLHVTAPKAGAYLLWLRFSAGGRVRTVPFVVAVA